MAHLVQSKNRLLVHNYQMLSEQMVLVTRTLSFRETSALLCRNLCISDTSPSIGMIPSEDDLVDLFENSCTLPKSSVQEVS